MATPEPSRYCLDYQQYVGLHTSHMIAIVECVNRGSACDAGLCRALVVRHNTKRFSSLRSCFASAVSLSQAHPACPRVPGMVVCIALMAQCCVLPVCCWCNARECMCSARVLPTHCLSRPLALSAHHAPLPCLLLHSAALFTREGQSSGEAALHSHGNAYVQL